MRKRLGLRFAILACALAQISFAQRWTVQYFYDHDHESLELVDLVFPSARRGIAVGSIYREHSWRDPKPVCLTTSDGGANWTQTELKEQPRSIFFLNDSLGWMVTDRGIWKTEESGLGWKKIDGQKGLLLRVWFLDERHGFGVGLQKTVLETKDGGKNWKPLAQPETPAADSKRTVYTQIAFPDSRRGLILGQVLPSGYRVPSWFDPERAASRRQEPMLTVELETRDGGASWKATTVPLPGEVDSMRITPSGGLVVMSFEQSEKWPSEVYHIDADGNSTRVFREPMSRIFDGAIFPGRRAILAGVEPPGRLASLPIPGKVKMFISTDLSNWKQMDVDYKAVAGSVVLAGPDADHLWAATDTGMILRQVP
jgi:Photosynthesis system II assembly factor YCF48